MHCAKAQRIRHFHHSKEKLRVYFHLLPLNPQIFRLSGKEASDDVSQVF
jgi:hypothetical protein